MGVKGAAMQQKVDTVLKSILILILSALVVLMMVQIEQLQGTARVINYAGLVRGATQREVKLEVTGTADDELIQYLDDILSGLKYADGHYDLVSLPDADYQQKLDAQILYWDDLKDEIYKVRTAGYENTDVVEMSETYFHMADETVSAAEKYSETIAATIRVLEILSAIDMVGLIALIIAQTVTEFRVAKRNRLLEQRAYLDLHTGLPNKSKVEELLHNVAFIKNPTACVMFDLNNLKLVNDTMGHSVGDQLIMNFARLLRDCAPPKDFVGRFGGDEFVAVLYDTSEEDINAFLAKLKDEVDLFNLYGKNVKVSYAYGWALSTNYENCTLRTLFDRADRYMYENKRRDKAARSNAKDGQPS